MIAAIFAAGLSGAAQTSAGSLRVSPVTFDVIGQRRAVSLTLLNPDERPMNVQVRVFRWTQVDGVDQLEPTTDVVASPPATTLAPKAEHLVRLVRVAEGAPTAEESYRVFVDEIPDQRARRNGQIGMVMRHSIPLFFSAEAGGASRLAWRMERTGSAVQLVASNTGARRARLIDMELKDSEGAVVHARAGLAGYVLPGAEMRWTVEGAPAEAGRSLTLTARSDAGPVHVQLAPPSGT